jgi:hypothetical protein
MPRHSVNSLREIGGAYARQKKCKNAARQRKKMMNPIPPAAVDSISICPFPLRLAQNQLNSRYGTSDGAARTAPNEAARRTRPPTRYINSRKTTQRMNLRIETRKSMTMAPNKMREVAPPERNCLRHTQLANPSASTDGKSSTGCNKNEIKCP